MSTETLNPDTFDIIAFIEGSNYPETEVTVYTDGKAALELRDLTVAPEGPDEAKVTELKEKIAASGIVFTLRGLAPKEVEMLMKKVEVNSKGISDEERMERFLESTDNLVAATITGVRLANGTEDKQSWDGARAKALRGVLIPSEFQKLSDAVATVNFEGSLFDGAVDAGFSSGRTESE